MHLASKDRLLIRAHFVYFKTHNRDRISYRVLTLEVEYALLGMSPIIIFTPLRC